MARGGFWCKPTRTRIIALSVGALALLSASGCALEDAAPTIDPARMALVEIGRSSRADVFATLGRPIRTERSTAGERWIYEAGPQSQGNAQLVSGVGAAAGIAGVFVPYLGLIGPGLSLANAASGTQPTGAARATLSVDFTAEGLARDCVYSSGAMPAGLPGAASVQPLGCAAAHSPAP